MTHLNHPELLAILPFAYFGLVRMFHHLMG